MLGPYRFIMMTPILAQEALDFCSVVYIFSIRLKLLLTRQLKGLISTVYEFSLLVHLR